MERMKIGYVVFEVSEPGRWQRFCADVLGLPTPVSNADGSEGYRLDEATQRLIVTKGRADDLGAIGLELEDEAAAERWLDRLTRAGVAIERDDALRAARRVRMLASFRDPAGNRIEAFVGPEKAEAPFASGHFRHGFATGELGMGHVVLVHRDLETMERFYVDVLGFAVTERMSSRVGPLPVRGTFLHCNRRHHSLALFDLPIKKRIHHFMLQVNALSDVGTAYERVRRLGTPLSLTLGQHAAPDSTFSFYGTTPSGFDFELGAGGGEIEPESWREAPNDATSSWGHEPTMRLKWKTLGAIVSSRLA